MLINKCTLCGKTSSIKQGIKFDSRSIKLKVPNYKNQMINIRIEINCVESDDDIKLAKLNDINQIKEMLNILKHEPLPSVISLELNDPDPCLCSNCEAEIIKLVHSGYGKKNRFDKF